MSGGGFHTKHALHHRTFDRHLLPGRSGLGRHSPAARLTLRSPGSAIDNTPPNCSVIYITCSMSISLHHELHYGRGGTMPSNVASFGVACWRFR